MEIFLPSCVETMCDNTAPTFIFVGHYCNLSINDALCADVNECATMNGGCSNECTNTVGSYYCSCPAGFTLSSNGHTCQGMYMNTGLHNVCIKCFTTVVFNLCFKYPENV